MNNNRKDRWIMFCCFFFITSVVVGAISIPNQFNSGDPISSSQMNTNFSTIKGHIDGIEGVIDYSSSTAKINAGTTRIASVATPTSGTDAATKDYVDTQVAASGGGGGGAQCVLVGSGAACSTGYTATGTFTMYHCIGAAGGQYSTSYNLGTGGAVTSFSPIPCPTSVGADSIAVNEYATGIRVVQGSATVKYCCK